METWRTHPWRFLLSKSFPFMVQTSPKLMLRRQPCTRTHGRSHLLPTSEATCTEEDMHGGVLHSTEESSMKESSMQSSMEDSSMCPPWRILPWRSPPWRTPGSCMEDSSSMERGSSTEDSSMEAWRTHPFEELPFHRHQLMLHRHGEHVWKKRAARRTSCTRRRPTSEATHQHASSLEENSSVLAGELLKPTGS